MYVTFQMNIQHRNTQVLSKAKSYRCLDNENSIVSNTLDHISIVSDTLDRPLHRDWLSL